MTENLNNIYVDNVITIKKNGKDEVIKRKQRVTLETDEHFTHALEFKGEFKNEDGSKVAKPILFIDKKEDGSYLINLKRTDLFKLGDKSLFDNENLTVPISADDKGILLKMDPNNSKIIASTKGEDLTFDIQGEDGKNYLIKTSATKISVEYDGQTFEYDTKGESTFDVSFARDTVEAFLDSKNKVCQTPSNINTKFPNYLIGMYGRTLKGNTQSKFGDYTITTIDMEGDNKSQPYLFVTKEKVLASGKVEQKTYLYIDGKFKEVTDFLCQYKKEGDKQTEPCFVLSVKDKKDTMKYYPLPITLKNGKIANYCIDAFKNLKSIAKYNETGIDGEVAYVMEGSGFTINAFARDNREYAEDYVYREKPKNSTVNFADDGDGDSGDSAGDTSGDSSPDGAGGDSGDTGSRNTGNVNESTPSEQNQQESQENEAEQEDDSEEEKEEPKEKEVKLKGFVEGLSNVSIYIGLFLVVGAMLTGFAILATVGFAVAVGGLVGTQVADKFVWKVPIRKAKEKIAKYEKEEVEEQLFEENFASQEQDLDKAVEHSAKFENAFKTLLESERPAIHNFVEAFNNYAVSFEGSELSPIETFIGMENGGYQRKALFNESINKINRTANPNDKNKLINQFINENFSPMPRAEEEKVRNLFKLENKQDLQDFSKALNSATINQKPVYDLQTAQAKALLNASDKKICKIAQSKKLEGAKRERFFERYSPALVRHFTTDSNFSEQKIINLTKNLSKEDKTIALEKLVFAQNKIQNDIENVSKVAKENRQAISAMQECKKVITALEEIDKLENVKSLLNIENESFDFFKKLTAKTYTVSEATDNAIENQRKEVEKYFDESDIKNTIKSLLNLHESAEANQISTTYRILTNAFNNRISAEVSHHYLEGTAGKTLPDLKKATPDRQYTIDSLIAKFATDEDRVAKEKLNQFKQNNKDLKANVENLVQKMQEQLYALDYSFVLMTSEQVKAQIESLKENLYFQTLSEDTQKAMANIYLQNQYFKEMEEKTPESEKIANYFEQSVNVLNLVNSKKLINYAKNKAIQKALNVDAKSVDIIKEGKNLKSSIDTNNKITKIVEAIGNKEAAERILNEFNNKLWIIEPKETLNFLIDNEFGGKQFDSSGKNYRYVISCAKNPSITFDINECIENQNKRSKTSVHSMDDTLGAGFINGEYKRRIDDIKNNRTESERFDTIFEYLAYRASNHITNEEERLNEYNKALIRIRERVSREKLHTEKEILKKFGLDDKEIKQARKNLRRTYSKRNAKKLAEEEIKFKETTNKINEFKAIWEGALTGNTQQRLNLKKWLESERDSETKFFEKLGIDKEGIIQAYSQSISSLEHTDKDRQSIETAKSLSEYEKNYHVIDKMNLYLSREEEKLEDKRDNLTLANPIDRKLSLTDRKLEKLSKNQTEFENKIQEILKANLTKEQLKNALSEFADDNFELLEELGVDSKYLKSDKKSSKKLKKLSELNLKFKQEIEELEKEVKKQEEKAIKEDDRKTDLDGKDSTKVKDNISFFGRIIEKLFTKHNEEIANSQSNPESEEARQAGDEGREEEQDDEHFDENA